MIIDRPQVIMINRFEPISLTAATAIRSPAAAATATCQAVKSVTDVRVLTLALRVGRKCMIWNFYLTKRWHSNWAVRARVINKKTLLAALFKFWLLLLLLLLFARQRGLLMHNTGITYLSFDTILSS